MLNVYSAVFKFCYVFAIKESQNNLKVKFPLFEVQQVPFGLTIVCTSNEGTCLDHFLEINLTYQLQIVSLVQTVSIF